MNLTLNGTPKKTEAQTLTQLVVELGYENRAVAIELNQQVIPKRLHDQTALKENDQLEIVTLVGGG